MSKKRWRPQRPKDDVILVLNVEPGLDNWLRRIASRARVSKNDVIYEILECVFFRIPRRRSDEGKLEEFNKTCGRLKLPTVRKIPRSLYRAA